MNKDLIDKAVNETKRCISSRQWRRDRKHIDTLFADEIIWIGKLKEQFYLGKEAVVNFLMQSADACPDFYVIKDRFWCSFSDKKSCIVSGQYYTASKIDGKEMISAQMRSTVVWKEEDGRLKLCYVHISSPVNDTEEDEEGFLRKVGRFDPEVVKSEEDGDDLLIVKDTAGNIRFINLTKTEAAEANRHNTNVFTADEEISLRVSWKDFLTKLDDSFVRVHRSYVVKKSHIKSIEKKVIEMASGRKIPYVKKYISDFFEENSTENDIENMQQADKKEGIL